MSGPFDHPSAGTRTKADLTEAVHALGVTRRDAAAHVDAVLDELCDRLAAGEEVKLTGFGKFEVVDRPPRPGRDPRSGDPLPLPARRVVVFRPSIVLREALTAALAPSAGEGG